MARQGASLLLELQESIVEYLWDDHKSLEACSLVSSQWSERARTLLYQDVTARIHSQFSLASATDNARSRRFMELLEAPQSRLGRYIQNIYIEGSDFSPSAAVRYLDEDLISVLCTTLPRLSRVCQMTLAFVDWEMIPEDVKIQLGHFTKVKSLTWKEVFFSHLDQLVVFSADNFPELQTLNIDLHNVKPMYLIDWCWFSAHPIKFPSLRALKLDLQESTASFLNAILSNIIVPVPNIDTLDLHIDDWSTLDSVNSFLRATGPTLHVLKLYSHDMIYLEDYGLNHDFFPSLKETVNLKSLHFRNCIWTRNILRTTSFALPNLEEIHIATSMGGLQLELVERSILERKAPNIKVIMSMFSWGLDVSDFLWSTMPELCRRGQVYCWTSDKKIQLVSTTRPNQMLAE